MCDMTAITTSEAYIAVLELLVLGMALILRSGNSAMQANILFAVGGHIAPQTEVWVIRDALSLVAWLTGLTAGRAQSQYWTQQ
jgi:hypothetical protein